MSTPIDLRKKFGHRWKIGLDESARGRWSDPWTYSIVCCHGEIIPWGGDLLAASTKNAGAIANRLRAAPFVEIAHDANDGVTVVFPSRHLPKVVAIMKPRRTKKATPAQLEALKRGRLRPPRRT
jgi:hypothetical protein